jgi:hypothetical protein
MTDCKKEVEHCGWLVGSQTNSGIRVRVQRRERRMHREPVKVEDTKNNIPPREDGKGGRGNADRGEGHCVGKTGPRAGGKRMYCSQGGVQTHKRFIRVTTGIYTTRRGGMCVCR